MYRFLIFILIGSLFLSPSLKGQSTNTVDQQMELAKNQMNEGDYEAANKTFRKILGMKTVLPHDLSYLFAETLYMVGQYENSDNFLTRYVEITGKGGNYTKQAEQLRELLKNKLLEIKNCNFCDIKGYRLKTCSICKGAKFFPSQCHHCNGHGALKCHVCLGEGVLIEKTDFETSEYQTCHNCNGKGVESCPVCKGAKIIEQKCSRCLGSGLESSKTLCDHKEHTLH